MLNLCNGIALSRNVAWISNRWFARSISANIICGILVGIDFLDGIFGSGRQVCKADNLVLLQGHVISDGMITVDSRNLPDYIPVFVPL